MGKHNTAHSFSFLEGRTTNKVEIMIQQTFTFSMNKCKYLQLALIFQSTFPELHLFYFPNKGKKSPVMFPATTKPDSALQ